MSAARNTRARWADALRVCAMLAVVMLHCASLPMYGEAPGTLRFLILDVLNGASRWAVPVFIMLSGAFLLDPDKPLTTRSWLRHLGHLLTLTLFWGYAYALYDARGAHLGLEWLLEALIRLVRAELHYHLWFLPMLLGLYLLLPLFRALVKGASRKTLWYLTALWAALCLVPTALGSLFPGNPLQPWLNLLELRGLTGYGGYFLLGYLLRTCDVKPRTAHILYGLGAAALLLTWADAWLRSIAANAIAATFYAPLTPAPALVASAVFLLFRRLEIGKSPLWDWLTPLSLGVYILHPFMLDRVTNAFRFPPASWNLAFAIPLRWVVVSLLSLAAAWLLRHIPKLGKRIL